MPWTLNTMLLETKNLSLTHIDDSANTFLKDVSLGLEENQTLALIGESGSGKTLTALAIMGLLPGIFRASGKINYKGKNLFDLDEKEMRLVRGREIAYTLQNQDALNPTLKIKAQLIEKPAPIDFEQAENLLSQVGLKSEVMNLYPHQLSGGMRQRVLLAIALSQSPKILIADEPTSGLDAAVIDQILDLLDELKEKNKLSLILITHDLSIADSRADRIAVMKDGCIVEQGKSEDIFRNANHFYTKALLEARI